MLGFQFLNFLLAPSNKQGLLFLFKSFNRLLLGLSSDEKYSGGNILYDAETDLFFITSRSSVKAFRIKEWVWYFIIEIYPQLLNHLSSKSLKNNKTHKMENWESTIGQNTNHMVLSEYLSLDQTKFVIGDESLSD